jgi:hypothetical protein
MISVGVTRIGNVSFFDCGALTNVVIPGTVSFIGNSAFEDDPFETLLIPNSVPSLGEAAFSDTGLRSVTIPNSVTSIPYQAFAFSGSLTNVHIGFAAFEQCTALGSVSIPDSVTNIDEDAFFYCTSLTNLVIGKGVTSLADEAFYFCFALDGVYFRSNAPAIAGDPFAGDNNALIYYHLGTSGWITPLDGIATVLWNPSLGSAGLDFGAQNNQFGFIISGTTNIPIVVEACSDLGSMNWVVLSTCALTNGSITFTDPTWTNYPRRFYRISAP